MTESGNTILIGGRVIGFIPPTEGQVQQMIRISRTLQTGPDDSPTEFWAKQIGRIGDLLDAMIVEADQPIVDALYTQGKITHTDLIRAIFAKINTNAQESENKAISKAKATRVQRK
jgi:hypothetical protein